MQPHAIAYDDNNKCFYTANVAEHIVNKHIDYTLKCFCMTEQDMSLKNKSRIELMTRQMLSFSDLN
jgi:hypothetical protein